MVIADGLTGKDYVEVPVEPDKFRALFPHIDWSRQLAYGERLGLGTRDHRLVKLR